MSASVDLQEIARGLSRLVSKILRIHRMVESRRLGWDTLQ
jgi:hypothetical protein